MAEIVHYIRRYVNYRGYGRRCAGPTDSRRTRGEGMVARGTCRARRRFEGDVEQDRAHGGKSHRGDAVADRHGLRSDPGGAVRNPRGHEPPAVARQRSAAVAGSPDVLSAAASFPEFVEP